MIIGLFLLVAIPSALGFGLLCESQTKYQLNGTLEYQAIPPNTKAAFFGDQGIESVSSNKPIEVLKMIKDWGAEFIIHSGDFDYINSPTPWITQVEKVLGKEYPYFASIGNHDLVRWTGVDGYEAKLLEHYRTSGIDKACTGTIGVNMACNWKGLLFVLSGVGTRGTDHEGYINSVFSTTPSAWKMCSWHKNQHLYQTGDKTDETGYPVYEACRTHGAIINTGHEHSYSRTYNMAYMTNQTIANRDAALVTKANQSFVFVSGLGGYGIRAWKQGLEKNAWWAALGASDNGVNFGALLCTFHIDNNPRKAHCDYKDISGNVFDSFDIFTENSETVASTSSSLKDIPTFIEIPVRAGGEHMTSKAVSRYTSPVVPNLRLSQTKNETTQIELTFNNVPLPRGAKLIAAHLQVLGAIGAQTWMNNGQNVETMNVNIRIKGDETTTRQVLWTSDEDNFEEGEVWVSPNLNLLVEEMLNHQLWVEGDSLSFFITANGSTPLEVYSTHYSECFAPTLALEFVKTAR